MVHATWRIRLGPVLVLAFRDLSYLIYIGKKEFGVAVPRFMVPKHRR